MFHVQSLKGRIIENLTIDTFHYICQSFFIGVTFQRSADKADLSSVAQGFVDKVRRWYEM